MHELYELKMMLCDELEKYGKKGDLSTGELDVVDKLAHATKNLNKIIESYEEETGHSGTYGPMHGVSYRSSYARGRNPRRDSMGRYSGERGYSRAAEDMVAQLRDMMQEAPDDATRREIERLIRKMESM